MNPENEFYSDRRRSWLLIPTILLMICCLIPLVVMMIGSIKPSMALYRIPADLNPFINVVLDNFKNVFKKLDVLKVFTNSVINSVSICLITLVVGVCGGYVFAKREFRGKRILFVVLLITMMLPRQIMMIPNYMVAKQLNLTDKPIGLILTSISSSYAIFMCKQFMETIPQDLLEAAKLDGCNEFQMFFRMVLPLSKPVMGSLAIFTFISSWNDFVWQNIMLTGKKYMTVPLALAFLDNQTDALTSLGNKMAGATMSAIPMLIIFIFCQRYFVKGIATGAVKE